MTCKSCAERRRKLAELKAAKKAKRQFIQAGAIGAVLKVSEMINGEVKDGEGRVQGDDAGSGQERHDDGAGINGGPADGNSG